MAEQASSQDFRVLGLKEGASRKEVKTAYREMAKRWHPDRFQEKAVSEQQRAEEIFKEISGAYRRISRGWAFSDNAAEGCEEKKSEESPPAEERAAGEEPAGERQGEPEPSQEEAAPSEEHPRREVQARFQGLRKSLQSLRVFIERRRNLLGAALILLLLAIVLLPLFETTTTHLPTRVEPARHAAPSVIVSGPEGTPSEEDESPQGEGENAPAAPRTISTPSPNAGGGAKDYNAGAANITMGSTQAAVVRVQGAPT
ncbi:MAG: DnaJ domain-containing protein, partial [Syntrophobacteraceae bacterium]